MNKREFRAYGLLNINSKAISKTEKKLELAGIPKDSYRINYFSNSAELVVEKSLLGKVRTTLG
jgi:hypothetical protein